MFIVHSLNTTVIMLIRIRCGIPGFRPDKMLRLPLYGIWPFTSMASLPLVKYLILP